MKLQLVDPSQFGMGDEVVWAGSVEEYRASDRFDAGALEALLAGELSAEAGHFFLVWERGPSLPASPEEAAQVADLESEVNAGDEGIGAFEYHGTLGFDSRPYCVRTFAGQVALTWRADEKPTGPEVFETEVSRTVLTFTPVPETWGVAHVETSGTDPEPEYWVCVCDFTYEGARDCEADEFYPGPDEDYR